jgi:phosphoadenosine phosphosulfate reductase
MTESAVLENHSKAADIPPTDDLEELNRKLSALPALERVNWAMRTFAGRVVLTSSFGAQSAVSLHMASRAWPEVPVVLIDTGNLFPETYRFIDELTDKLNLNLKIYSAKLSQNWQIARYGKLWEQGVEGIEQYNYINKVEPMQRALEELEPQLWMAGLRSSQSSSRQNLKVVTRQNGILKLHPILEWNDRDIYRYMKEFDLPYHPLWYDGYVSIGDVQTTTRLGEGMDAEDTRFFGLKRECGLHEEAPPSYEI